MDKMEVNPSGLFKVDIGRSFNSLIVGCYAWQSSEHHGKFLRHDTQAAMIMGTKWKEDRNLFKSLRQ
jgi:hypothetical protein